ncbi:MAG: transposase [Leptospiraceae bacterium]|nr:transposase [Leptospiraceae bacterium]
MLLSSILYQFKGKTVHDFYRSYFKFDFEHVLCNAHLLRELIFEKEENLQKWAGKMIELLLKIKKQILPRLVQNIILHNFSFIKTTTIAPQKAELLKDLKDSVDQINSFKKGKRLCHR